MGGSSVDVVHKRSRALPKLRFKTVQLLLSILLNIFVLVEVVSTGLRFVWFTKKELKKLGQNQTIKRR